MVPLDLIKNDKKSLFLATTALQQTWQTSGHLVLIGPWCKRFGEKSTEALQEAKILESPYNEEGAVEKAQLFTREVYERSLPCLADSLNLIHNRQYGKRFWQIFAGPWLHYYIVVNYDRYLHLKKALELYPTLDTLILSQEAFTTPSNTLDFIVLSHDDLYNLQIFSKIFKSIGKSFPSINLDVARSSKNHLVHLRSWRWKLFRLVEKVYENLFFYMRDPIVLKDSHFRSWIELSILRYMPLTLYRNKSTQSCESKKHCDLEMRKKLLNIFAGSSEFEKCLSQMFSEDLPMCFLEDFEICLLKSSTLYPKRPKAILSATAWYHDELFKCWAARAAEGGSILLGAQHGGNYGSLSRLFFEEHETSILDIFYTWGWHKTSSKAQIKILPAQKLVGRAKLRPDNSKNGILWGITAHPRYMLHFNFLPKDFEEYLCWQSDFLTKLPSSIRGLLRLRPHAQDYDWGIVERLREVFPELTVETWKRGFDVSLSDCRIYICDHLSTTFIEALALGKPTIIFWKFETVKLCDEAKPYYEMLSEAGILFDQPETAGEVIGEIYDDVESWWNENERQIAVKTFCSRFANYSKNGSDLWLEELKRINGKANLTV